MSIPGMSPAIPDGTFVRIRARATSNAGYWVGCTRQVVVQNLAAWEGSPKPTSDAGFVWFAGLDSYNIQVFAPTAAPLAVDRELVCESAEGA